MGVGDRDREGEGPFLLLAFSEPASEMANSLGGGNPTGWTNSVKRGEPAARLKAATTCQTPTDPIIDGNSWISVSLPGGIIGCGPDDNVGTPDWRKSLRRFKPTSDICLHFPQPSHGTKKCAKKPHINIYIVSETPANRCRKAPHVKIHHQIRVSYVTDAVSMSVFHANRECGCGLSAR